MLRGKRQRGLRVEHDRALGFRGPLSASRGETVPSLKEAGKTQGGVVAAASSGARQPRLYGPQLPVPHPCPGFGGASQTHCLWTSTAPSLLLAGQSPRFPGSPGRAAHGTQGARRGLGVQARANPRPFLPFSAPGAQGISSLQRHLLALNPGQSNTYVFYPVLQFPDSINAPD